MSKHSFTPFFVALIFALSTHAETINRIVFSELVSEKGQQYVLNGAGVRTYMFVDVYAAGLYLIEKKANGFEILDSKTDKMIRMHYFREISKKDLEKVWLIALKENCKKDCETFEKAFSQFTDAVIEVKPGTEITYIFNSDYLIVKNPEKAIKIEKSQLAEIVLSTWIGEKPPTSSLKRSLLGKK